MTSDGWPPHLSWRYDRAEILADGLVHALGLLFGTTGVVVLITQTAERAGARELISVAVYAAGLMAVLGISAAYNLWPVSRVKWWLRRVDHSAIYLLIAGTYTPFIASVKATVASISLLIGIWATSIMGMALKFLLPGRFDRLSIVLYLALGWCGVVAYEPVFAALPDSTVWLIAAGGMLYSTGVIFHLWESLRFHNAIWHAFVLAAAACHYAAVLDCVVLAQP